MRETIIREIQKGDRKAFREVFDHYFNALSSFGYSFVEDIGVSEDMVQEVFISLWEKRKDFNHINALKSFLYTSVRNKCFNYLKHEQVKKKHEASLIYEIESDHTFNGRVVEEEVFNQLFENIKDLPNSSREIMLLALNGLKNQEIADELGISINTVKTQKKIAYSKIKDSLGSKLSESAMTLLLISFFLINGFTRF